MYIYIILSPSLQEYCTTLSQHINNRCQYFYYSFVKRLLFLNRFPRIPYQSLFEMDHSAYRDNYSSDTGFSHKFQLFSDKINVLHVWVNHVAYFNAR